QPLLAWCEAAASAPEEPVSVDAERASSYRYSSRAYLVQLRTDTAGTALIDPLAFSMPGTLSRTLAEREWALHAAAQVRPGHAAPRRRRREHVQPVPVARLLRRARGGLGAAVGDAPGRRGGPAPGAAGWARGQLPGGGVGAAPGDVEVRVEGRDGLEGR